MKIELHLLQNFAPSNLNRDDTGSPKDCEFGGVRRARVSSQCLKRSIREAFRSHSLLQNSGLELGARTKRLVSEIATRLESRGRDANTAQTLAAFALQAGGLKVKEDKTEYLLFLPTRCIDELADLVHEVWDQLQQAAPPPSSEQEDSSDNGKKKAPKNKSKEKAAAKEAVPKEISQRVLRILQNVEKTPDLALFGRMIADNPDWNVDAACQVAHAISTHRASLEFDFYTAVDDLKGRSETGSDMMGTIAFQSACFYRYACLDMDSLQRNLMATNADASRTMARETLRAFLKASALAIPTGKQNSMAAQNLPSYMVAITRRGGAPVSLANAFVKPVRPSSERDLVAASVDALEEYLSKTTRLWGSEGMTVHRCGEVEALSAPGSLAPDFSSWVESVVQEWERA